MYKTVKTVRHGENSLQYTILPQNDDLRIEGKLTSAESSCSSSGRKSKTKRPRRRSFFTYLGLIFVCTVIVGAVLIPFLVSAECLPNPKEWFMGKQIEKHEKTASPLKGRGNLGFSGPHGSFVGNGINVGKTVKIINQYGIEKIILRVNKTSNATENVKNLPNVKSNKTASIAAQNNGDINQTNNFNIQAQENFTAGNAITTIGSQHAAQNGNDTVMIAQNKQNVLKLETAQKSVDTPQSFNNPNGNFIDNSNPPAQHFVTEVRFEPAESVSSMPPGVVPTIVVTTLRNQYDGNDVADQQPQRQQEQQLPQLQAQTAPNVRPSTTFSTSVQSQLNNGNLAVPNSTLMTRIIQVPLLKAAAKKPVIPPVLIKTNSQLSTANGIDALKNANPALATTTSSPQLPGVPSVINDIDAGAGPKVVPAKATDWIKDDWPFIDYSTYFQWTDYKTEDSVLLPALLGFALIGIVLTITVCLVARNKRTIVSSVRRRNRNASDIEETGAEDNTTLLTTSNLSDED